MDTFVELLKVGGIGGLALVIVYMILSQVVKQQRDTIEKVIAAHCEEQKRAGEFYERLARSNEDMAKSIAAMIEKIDTNQYCPLMRPDTSLVDALAKKAGINRG